MSSLDPKYYRLPLPLTDLHIMEVGAGEPAIMMPATTSLLDDWLELAQFLGQRFQIYFFELPGHGQSTPFPEPYSSDLTAAAIEMLLDALGLETATLFGFSFGGILTLKTLHRIQERINALVLLAPCVGPATLRYSPAQQFLMRRFIDTIRHPAVQPRFLEMLKHDRVGDLIVKGMVAYGKIERPDVPAYQAAESIGDHPRRVDAADG